MLYLSASPPGPSSQPPGSLFNFARSLTAYLPLPITRHNYAACFKPCWNFVAFESGPLPAKQWSQHLREMCRGPASGARSRSLLNGTLEKSG